MAKYLDADGLQHYHDALQPSMVRGLTQAEYDALPEDKKAGLCVITDGQPSGGGAGISGNGIPVGFIGLWSGNEENIPDGWALCDGENGTPDLRDKFVLGAGTSHSVGNTGGSEEVTLTPNQMPKHKHEISGFQGTDGTTNAMLYTAKASGVLRSTYTADNGGSEPHPNMPPYYALCYIMKTQEAAT